MTNNQAPDETIQRFIADYFEVIHAQDMDLFDKVFHKDCVLYSGQGGELAVRPFALYREQVANRQSPKELGNTRRDEILMVDQISDTLAVVKCQLEMFGGVMQDFLNIVKLDGRWIIVAKTYERVGDAA